MRSGSTNNLLHHLRRAALLANGAGLTDGELLEGFINRRDEVYFEALVRRHGPMVLGVCRRVLHNPHDAEDAFQATFLVLVRRAASIVPRNRVGNWLYGVAYRTALEARRAAARRRAREHQVPDMPHPLIEPDEFWPELRPLLDQELNRLPEKYRTAVVLCHLEGRTRKEAARQLGLPIGTLSGRLTTALRILAKRLSRHGLMVSGGTLAAALIPNTASAGVPAMLIASTTKAATLHVAGQAAAGFVSTEVAALMKGVLYSMFWAKIKLATTVLVAVVVTAAGAGALAYRLQAAPVVPEEARGRSDAKTEDGLKELAQARVRAAEKAFELVWEAYLNQHREEEDVYRWSVRVLEAQREVATNRSERMAAIQKHLDRMTKLEVMVPTRFRKPGVPPPAENFPIAEFYRVEAEFWLEGAKRDK